MSFHRHILGSGIHEYHGLLQYFQNGFTPPRFFIKHITTIMEEIKFFPKEDVCFHLCALKKLAIVDGFFHDSEKQIINQIAQMYLSFYPDLDFETVQKMELSEDEYNQGLEKLKQNPILSRLLLKDLITLGHADGNYSKPEQEMVRVTAQKLDVSEEHVRLLEKAVDDLNRATLFMNNVLFS